MTMSQGVKSEAGILAIWNDCDSAREAEYEEWYRGEHLAERLSVPGFRSGHRYETLDGKPPRFFTRYDLDAPSVLVSPAYLAQTANPSALTRKVMSERIFLNLNRTACRRTFVVGDTRGAFALTARWSEPSEFAAVVDGLEHIGAELAGADLALRAEVWQAVAEGTHAASVEQSLRGSVNQSIAGAFIIEVMREAELAHARRVVGQRLGENVTIGGYRLLCSMSKGDMSA